MPAFLRRHFTHPLLPGLQILFLGAVLQRPPAPWPGVALGLFALCALWGWWHALRHARAIADLPTSRVASAAQGYTELRGRARPLGGTPLLSPVTGLPVLWYRVETQEQDSEDRWKRIALDESDASFLLEDDSGSCAVDPEGALMRIGREEITLHDGRRYIQHYLLANDPLYALGDFATLGSVALEFDTRAEVRRLLAEWKTDKPRLLQRFDLDGNGELDLHEWELARAQARREVARNQQALRAAPEVHVMRQPEDGRLYLISDLGPERLVRNMKIEAGVQALLFLAACGGLAWLHLHGAF